MVWKTVAVDFIIKTIEIYHLHCIIVLFLSDHNFGLMAQIIYCIDEVWDESREL